MKRSRIKWDTSYYPPFQASYFKLNPHQRWFIDNQLNHIRFFKSVKHYVDHINCPHVPVQHNEDYYSLDIAKDGYGNFNVKLLLFEDKEQDIIWAIDCYDYSLEP